MKRRRFGLMVWCALLFGGWLIGVSTLGASSGVELQNLDFEEGENGWVSWGEGDLRPEYYGLLPSSGEQFLRLWNRSGWYQDFPTVPGRKYHVTARVGTAGSDALWGDAFGEVKVEWRKVSRDEDDGMVGLPVSVKFSCDQVLGRHSIRTDEWEWIVLPVVEAPEQATHGRIFCTIYTLGGKQGGGCALFDEITVEPIF
ncbi:MAG: hypothetical protein PHG65_08875 [Kiritimatiellae bacterium]|nr:hypothetical protein [Kiritimatiellia bacterium]